MKLSLTETQVQDVLNATRIRTEDLEYQKENLESSVTALKESVTHLQKEVDHQRQQISVAVQENTSTLRMEALAHVKTLLSAISTPGFPEKIKAIRAVRELTWIGLKEAKELVEAHQPIAKKNEYKIYVSTTPQGVKPERHMVYLHKNGVEVVYRPCKNHKEAESVGSGMTQALLLETPEVHLHYCEPGQENPPAFRW